MISRVLKRLLIHLAPLDQILWSASSLWTWYCKDDDAGITWGEYGSAVLLTAMEPTSRLLKPTKPTGVHA